METSENTQKRSSGVAKAGMTLGIIGTSLAGLLWANNNNGGGLGGIFGGGNNNQVSTLQAELAEVNAQRYADKVAAETYAAAAANSKETNARIDALVFALGELDKKTALNEQATKYESIITNNKIDYNKQISELSDAAIISYVNSTFIPGRLVMPASNIFPPVSPLAQ